MIGIPLEPFLPGPRAHPHDDHASEPDVPWYIDRLGQAGIILALTGLALTILGITTLLFGPFVYAAILLTLAIATVTIAMLLGVLYHASHAPYPLQRNP